MKSDRFDCEMLQEAHGNTAITLFCMAKNWFFPILKSRKILRLLKAALYCSAFYAYEHLFL